MRLASLSLLAAVWQGVVIPPPRGFVSDFAGVLDSAAIRRMTAIAADVRAKTGGDIAVVTVADLAGRDAADVALQIGRQWGVGGQGEAGDPRRNLGVVILVQPLKNHQPGTGDVFIATGRGAEGFLTDAAAGRIRDAMVPALRQEDYDAALTLGTTLVARAFAEEFHVTLDSAATLPAAPVEAPDGGGVPVGLIVLAVVFVLMLMGRGGILPWIFLGSLGGGRRGGGWGGGWGGGGGGGFGGFGGFGGGGGFSGGGAGGRF